MDLAGKKILVVGLARTGVACARFLAQAGAKVTVTDMAPAAALEEPRREIQGWGIKEELGVPQPSWQGYDLMLLSPGVPPELPWIAAAQDAGIPVWGELELASHFFTKPLIAVSKDTRNQAEWMMGSWAPHSDGTISSEAYENIIRTLSVHNAGEGDPASMDCLETDTNKRRYHCLGL